MSGTSSGSGTLRRGSRAADTGGRSEAGTRLAAVRHGAARRGRLVSAALAVAVVVAFGVSLSVGTYAVSLPDVVRVLAGEQLPGAQFVVLDLRLPRAVTAIGVGMAFGLSGILFQTLVRNPLASPDIIGITAGASAAAVAAIVVLDLPRTGVAAAAFGGAIATAAAIYLLAYRGGVSGYRLVLVGIGIGALLNAVVTYLLTRALVTDAQQALVWITGSLNSSAWDRIPALAGPLLVLVPLAFALARPLRGLQLGAELAAGLGVRVNGSTLALVLVAVALAAVGTAAAGPIAFVAFVSGPIARRLTRGSGSSLAPAALVGALLVLVSDLAAQHLVPGVKFPVGVVTGIVGAPYLLWLLTRVNRAGQGG